MNKDDAVARVFDIQFAPGVTHSDLTRFKGMFYLRLPDPRDEGVIEIPVPAVIYRWEHLYYVWDLAVKDAPIYVGDIIRTDHRTSMALELLIGARLGIKKGSTVKIISDTDAAVLTDSQWNTIALNSGGVFAKFHRKERPLTIQTRGGVMGIKG